MSKIITYPDENSVDICIRAYGNIEGLVAMCLENGIALDHEETAPVERLVDDVLKAELKKVRTLFQPVVVAKRNNNVVESDQNIVDLALQEMGSIEGLVSLLRENGIGFSNEPAAGVIINVKTADIVNLDVREFYRGRSYKVNTGVFVDNIMILEDGQYMLNEDDALMYLEGSL